MIDNPTDEYIGFVQMDDSTKSAQWLTFSPCGLKINLNTGEVIIPQGLTLDEASRAFWEGLGQYKANKIT